jgi:hypothetical protein
LITLLTDTTPSRASPLPQLLTHIKIQPSA